MTATPDLRRARILEHIEQNGGASVAELTRVLHVAPVTIHRDLELMAEDDLIVRVRGGARPKGDQRMITGWSQRLAQAWAEKQQIAAQASRYVETGSTIFIDSSTTGYALAKLIERKPPTELTLVTNSPVIACEFYVERVHVIVVGGELDQTVRTLGGRLALEFLGGLNIQTAFISGAGLTLEQGLTTSRPILADTLQAAIAVSQRTIALVDSTKFGRHSLLTIAALTDLDTIIVDQRIDEETRARYLGADASLEVSSASPS